MRAGGLRHSWQATYRTKAPMDGWFVLGMNRDDHEVAVDRTRGHNTSSSARIRSRDASVTSPTLVTQHFLAHDYHGQRLRLSAWLKCEHVTRSALLWMLLEDNTRLLLFTTATPITGTTDWTRREIRVRHRQRGDADPDRLRARRCGRGVAGRRCGRGGWHRRADDGQPRYAVEAEEPELRRVRALRALPFYR